MESYLANIAKVFSNTRSKWKKTVSWNMTPHYVAIIDLVMPQYGDQSDHNEHGESQPCTHSDELNNEHDDKGGHVGNPDLKAAVHQARASAGKGLAWLPVSQTSSCIRLIELLKS